MNSLAVADDGRQDRHDDHVQSLARGLAVLRSFSADSPRQTLADVARATALTRATARRLLLTLVDLGYARTDGKHFELTPQVLDIGYSFLASLNLNEIVQPYLEELSERLGESTSVSVLDDTDIVYIARVPTKRIMTVAIGLGSRFPAYRTSMGRVLLAELDDDELADVYARSRHDDPTEHTVRDVDALLEAIATVRRDGWSMVDQELELGVRSIAAPVHNAAGCTVAAVNVSTQVGRTGLDELVESFVPALLSTASRIDAALGMR